MSPKDFISDEVRVRFAPSPTGQVHVGNARTALFNWLYARQQGGKFVLRIEDTDVERSEKRYEDQLLEDIRWLGLDWDEGPDVAGSPYPPYRQSDKLDVYQKYAEQLVAEGKAYYCFCSQAELDAHREQAMAAHEAPIYPGTCRKLDPAEALRRKQAGEPCAIRLKIPEHPIRFHDIVRGTVEFSNEAISDPIILRSSGVPVYNYVVVVDDAEMKITHVIRGDDHLSNTPKQVAIYEAMGWPVPQFAHLSTILGPDGSRLSKRHGATSLANFREMGVLPEALMNYMALLGWAPTGGTRELFTPEELKKEFRLKRVTPSPAVFDFEKLYWINRQYIKKADPARIAALAKPFFVKENLLPENTAAELDGWFEGLVALLAPSANKLDELPEKAHFFHHFDAAAALASEDNAEVLGLETTASVLDAFAAKIAAEAGDLTAGRFKAIIAEVQADTGAKGKALYHPIRIAITGSHSGPEFDKVIPLIETGSHLALPTAIPSLHQRVAAFEKARGK
jgi:glutamyl-tRNA synthetase/nondiscriminating glutamyl-tRNA synthetase